ncbi:probable mannitol dehydrogenase isoform X2 [Punica granatum]|uniref:cinnamyl-alcohol dehydrogenase n=1 Tax=Punica granatum TaxID=22663 RepID=A0A6P8C5I5_PUNGR|nr:probable mannitol dehydrogenase isoform X2 [Punica granatum]
MSNGEDDITVKIHYCGVCHSDLHIIRDEHGISQYPIIPGHEIVGVVTQVGTNVDKFKAGDIAGVGSLVGSCGACDNCRDGLESYCPSPLYTCTMLEFEGQAKQYGGYSDIIVVNQHFAVCIPDGLYLPGCAPLLCAGITVYSPIRNLGLDQPGKHIGVVGLGGLGHLAVKFAKAFGAVVTVISSSEHKRMEATEQLGSDSFLVCHDSRQMQAAAGTMHGIIDTVSAHHPLKPLLDLLRTDGKLVMLGAPDLDKPAEIPLLPLLGRKYVTGSMAGGMKETQEMMDFAGKHNITANVEVIPMDYVNRAMDRLARGDVRYRFVIDIGSTLDQH